MRLRPTKHQFLRCSRASLTAATPSGKHRLWLAEVRDLSYNDVMHKHLRRLDRIWLDSPIYFITMCTKGRRAVLARDEVAEILVDEWGAAHKRHGWAVGRYVIMPDHVHFFCRPELGATKLSQFIGTWKSWTSRKIHALGGPRSATAATALWQREFFDHVLRSDESYSEKWNYVFDNPVRAGLVSIVQDWKYAGEIETLML